MTHRRFVQWFFAAAWLTAVSIGMAEPLPGTRPLVFPTDPDAVHALQVRQVKDYFERCTREAQDFRDQAWLTDVRAAEPSSREQSMAKHRADCHVMLGLDERAITADGATSERITQTAACRVDRVVIPISSGIAARGLLFVPVANRRPDAVIVCPDADQWPEHFLGLDKNSNPPDWLRTLLARGATVWVPYAVERLCDHPYCRQVGDKDRRHILYRLAYPVGRTMPGLDVTDVLAAAEYLLGKRESAVGRVAVVGFGQGGMTALYAAAVDRRVAAAVVADYFQDRHRCWQEPVDRRLPGQLLRLADAEVAALIAPRPLCILRSADKSGVEDGVSTEFRRVGRLFLNKNDRLQLVTCRDGQTMASRAIALAAEALELPEAEVEFSWPGIRLDEEKTRSVRDEHFEERVRYLRRLIADSQRLRTERWNLAHCDRQGFPRLKEQMLAEYRRMVGTVPTGDVPLNPRSELALRTDRYTAYRVLLDVIRGVQVYGNLLIPHAAKGRTAAVICQHGLHGMPEMITGLGMDKDTPYHEFGRRLAERGYVVFAPYLTHRDPAEISELARRADAVGMMRVAMPVAKTRRVVDFLQTLPMVDGERIGYYGLSYGGYSALWISPLEERLRAVVVSGHFNDWRAKITDDSLRTSYLWHPDEDFTTWDILPRFTHPELIAMVAPRATCVEFALRDGITTPEWTLRAWSQVIAWRDPLGLSDRITLAQFDGVHEVHCVESFEFLDRFLRGEGLGRRD